MLDFQDSLASLCAERESLQAEFALATQQSIAMTTKLRKEAVQAEQELKNTIEQMKSVLFQEKASQHTHDDTAPPFQSITRDSTVPPFRSATFDSTAPPFRSATLDSTVPPFRSATLDSTAPPFRSDTLDSTVPPFRSATLDSTAQFRFFRNGANNRHLRCVLHSATPGCWCQTRLYPWLVLQGQG